MGARPAPADPEWLDRAEYPFTSRYFDGPGGRMHYVDEGAGDPILFVHGNPTWSFEHRRLIRALRGRYRCLAVDHIGFGLSEKPPGASYAPQFHAHNLAALIDHLGLERLTLVVHDWGGPIGLSYALDNPDRIAGLVVYNSWFWSVRGERAFEMFSALMGGPLGRFLCVRFNFFARVMLRHAGGDPRAFTPTIHRQYLAPFPTPASRKGTWVFPKSIIGESAWLEGLWRRRAAISDKPVLLLWGLEDAAFSEALLGRWQGAFPNHVSHSFPGVGHFAPEQLGDRAVAPVETLLASLTPGAARVGAARTSP